MLRAAGLSKARSVYTPTVTGYKGPRPAKLSGSNQVRPRAFVLLVQVLGHDVAAHIRGLDAPVGRISQDHCEGDGGVIRRRVPDEPAVPERPVVGFGVQRPSLTGDLDGQVALAAFVAERPL